MANLPAQIKFNTMPASNYIPAKDTDFDAWLNNFQTLIDAAPATYGLEAGDATAITAAYNAWHAAYVTATTPATRTSPAIAEKDVQRANAEAVVRPFAQSISHNSGVTNENKTAVGVNLPNPNRTPVPPPTTAPALSLVQGIANQVTLAYYDTSTPTTKAKPAGAIGLELRRTIATNAGTDPEAASLVGIVTKSPTVVAHGSGDRGKLATFWGRWSTRSGPGGVAQSGPWSDALVVVLG